MYHAIQLPSQSAEYKVLKNMGAILEAAGASYANVVKWVRRIMRSLKRPQYIPVVFAALSTLPVPFAWDAWMMLACLHTINHCHPTCRTTILLADMADFAKVNTIYARYFTDQPPARATFAVKDLPMAARVEIEATAVLWFIDGCLNTSQA